MINSYLNITTIAEWCAFIASVWILDKKTKHWQLFKLLLLLGLCTEIFGWFAYYKLKIKHNGLPFNILMLISNSFFLLFYAQSNYMRHFKKKLIFFSCFFIAFGLINLFFFQGLWEYNSFSEASVDIMLALVSCYFLFTVLNDKEYVNLLSLDYFWLATGLLFYCLGCALLYPFGKMLENFSKETNINVGNYISYSLNLILYSSLIIAFICTRKATR